MKLHLPTHRGASPRTLSTARLYPKTVTQTAVDSTSDRHPQRRAYSGRTLSWYSRVADRFGAWSSGCTLGSGFRRRSYPSTYSVRGR